MTARGEERGPDQHEPDRRMPGDGPAGPEAAAPGRPKRRVWWLYTRVMIVQVVTLILLWLLQSTYGR